MMDLGTKLKAMRLQCNLTQEELANRCELTKGYISQLENDLTTPSIATLVDILAALGSNLKNFFNDDTNENVIFKEDDYFVKATDEHTITWLIPNSQKNEIEPILMEIQPNCSTTTDMPHEGEEFGYILQGSAILHIGNKTYKIKEKESFYFVSDRVHFIENSSKGVTRLLWISSPPTF